jgi:hypothetical protein
MDARGKWPRINSKVLVEDGLVLSVGRLPLRHLKPGGNISGSLMWRNAAVEHTDRVAFTINMIDAGKAILKLAFSRQDTAGIHHVAQCIRLVNIRQAVGCDRWWFECPACEHNAPTQRQFLKLYLPPNRAYFACRECHGLGYRSWHRRSRARSAIGAYTAVPVAERQMFC